MTNSVKNSSSLDRFLEERLERGTRILRSMTLCPDTSSVDEAVQALLALDDESFAGRILDNKVRVNVLLELAYEAGCSSRAVELTEGRAGERVLRLSKLASQLCEILARIRANQSLNL